MLDGRRYRVEQNQASPEYFGILRARFVAGRPYTRDEAAQKAPVAVITAGLARDFWPDGDALGSTLDRVHELYKGLLVIGIVGDVAPPTGRRPNAAGFGTIYRPVIEPDRVQMVVLLASQGGQSLDTMRDAIAAIDANREPRLSLLQDELARQLAGPRLMAGVAAILGGLALVLAVVGILGVTFVLVGQRRRELGVRMAIGATPWDVVRIVFRQGMWPVVIGLVAGIGLALIGTQMIGSYLVGGVSARDPIAFGLAAAVLLTSAAVGVLIPARRATRVDPVAALREP
jgi:hypothetical protein